MGARVQFNSSSPDDTVVIARSLGGVVRSQVRTFPFVIALEGRLGAGKTCFTRGFMTGFDARFAEWVSSPTYALCNVYPSEPPVHHVDAYRLSGTDDLETIAYWDFVEEGPVLIEWPSRVPAIGESVDVFVTLARASTPDGVVDEASALSADDPKALNVILDSDGHGERVISIEGRTGAGRAVVRALSDSVLARGEESDPGDAPENSTS